MIGRIVRKKQPWRKFFVKATVVAAFTIVAMATLMNRYQIGIDSQEDKCIPGYTFYLIDKKDRSVQKKGIYAFASRGLAPIFDDGTILVKFAVGIPGDSIEVRPDLAITVNNVSVGQGLAHLETLGLSKEQFIGQRELDTGKYWFMGISDRSFDSRYWGTVDDDQIVGRAYPLF